MNGCKWCLNIDRKRGHAPGCAQFGRITGTFFRSKPNSAQAAEYLMLIGHGNSERDALNSIRAKEAVHKKAMVRLQQLAKVEQKRQVEQDNEEFLRRVAQKDKGGARKS